MKSLYSILGVSADATPPQIEAAYAESLAQFKNDSALPHKEDQRIRFVAIKEAYSVLSDPLKRQLYNQKLFAPETLTRRTGAKDASDFDDSGSSGIKKLLVIGVFAIGGMVLYSNHVSEIENLRIQHEHEVQMKAVQVMEDAQQQAASVSDSLLERQKQLDTLAQERQRKVDLEQFNRESEMRRQQNLREEDMKSRREMSEKRQAEWESENKRRREADEALRRVQRDKAELQRLERLHYGRTITY